MFGTNQITGRKFFYSKGTDSQQVKVTTVFRTLQGEGPFAGRPAVFLRLTHCNLKCWFCDTNFEHGDWMEPVQLMELVEQVLEGHDPSDHVLVITGGEPLLQATALFDRLSYWNLIFSATQIESNGLLRSEIPSRTVLVISPKADKEDGKYLRPPKEMLERANCLKFVLRADPSSVYHTVPDWAFKWRDEYRRHVYVSPMAEYLSKPAAKKLAKGTGDRAARTLAERVSFWTPDLMDVPRCRDNHMHTAAYALKHGVFMSMQMHLFAGLP